MPSSPVPAIGNALYRPLCVVHLPDEIELMMMPNINGSISRPALVGVTPSTTRR